MRKVKNISKGPLYLESGTLDPGDSGEATAPEYALLKSNHRIIEYDPAKQKAPEAPATKPAPKRKPAAKKPAAAAPDFL